MNMKKEIGELTRMTVTELRAKHIDVFGERTRSGHKVYLVKRISWRMQANVEGDLTKRAKQRAEELANDPDLRTNAQCKVDDGSQCGTKTSTVNFEHDDRVPMPGAIITRTYKGFDVAVRVLPKGFDRVRRRDLSNPLGGSQGCHWHALEWVSLFQVDQKWKTLMII
jgi:hypothetical protein